MRYVDIDFYREQFQGSHIESEDFCELEGRATEIVEEMTMYRLNPVAWSRLPACDQLRVKQAVCAQMEYLDANGGADLDTGADLQSASLGKFSYAKASSGSDNDRQSVYAPRAMRILAPTGLLYRGGCL